MKRNHLRTPCARRRSHRTAGGTSTKIRAVCIGLGVMIAGCYATADASPNLWHLQAPAGRTPAWRAPTVSRPATHTIRRTRPAPTANRSGFSGSWRNVNRNARGLKRVDIARTGSRYRVHAWGSCHPRDCDWGSVTAVAYGRAVNARQPVALSAVFRHSNGTTTLILRRNGSQINAEVMTAFSPGRASGRSNFVASERLAAVPGGTSVASTGSASPPPSSPRASSPPASSAPTSRPSGGSAKARFRVIVTGFTVNQQTWDDASNHDGKGDEDFLLTHVTEVGPRGKVIASSDPRSRVMGDTNGWRGRVHAGTAKTFMGGPPGGLATGDQYPSSRPWQFRGRAYDDRAPELVWQGTLTQGGGGVLIVPTIWEWDEAGGDILLRDWAALEQRLNKAAGPIVNTLTGGASKPFVDGANAAWGVLRSNELAKVLGHAATRPIGLQEDGKGRQSFKPTIIKLTYDTAEHILQSNFGKGNGVLEIQYRDSTRLRGDYTIYVKVQRM